jgi:hypothetical protein
VPGEAQVVLGARDEEGSGRGEPIETFEIHVTTVHHIEGSGLQEQFVQPEHIVLARAADVDAGGNGAAQIDLRVHFDPCFGAAEVGPRKKREREIGHRSWFCSFLTGTI